MLIFDLGLKPFRCRWYQQIWKANERVQLRRETFR